MRMAVGASCHRCNLIKTFSSTRSVPGVPMAKRPWGLRGFARRALVLAWIIFWINTALFPCCEAVAAAFGDHSDDVSQSVSLALPAHASDDTHSERPHHSPDAPCGYTLSVGPTSVGMSALLAPDDSSLQCFAIDAPAAPALTAVSQAEYLAPREPPPQPHRLYQRTLRLLI